MAPWSGRSAAAICCACRQKVQRNNGNMFIAVFRKRLDPLEPRETPPLLGNDVAAQAASQAGYTPKAGGEKRGMTW